MKKILIICIVVLLSGCSYMRLARFNGTCPDHLPIKGNADSFYYHVPSSPYYYNTKAEFCFATEEDARRHGYFSAKRK